MPLGLCWPRWINSDCSNSTIHLVTHSLYSHSSHCWSDLDCCSSTRSRCPVTSPLPCTDSQTHFPSLWSVTSPLSLITCDLILPFIGWWLCVTCDGLPAWCILSILGGTWRIHSRCVQIPGPLDFHFLGLYIHSLIYIAFLDGNAISSDGCLCLRWNRPGDDFVRLQVPEPRDSLLDTHSFILHTVGDLRDSFVRSLILVLSATLPLSTPFDLYRCFVLHSIHFGGSFDYLSLSRYLTSLTFIDVFSWYLSTQAHLPVMECRRTACSFRWVTSGGGSSVAITYDDTIHSVWFSLPMEA